MYNMVHYIHKCGVREDEIFVSVENLIRGKSWLTNEYKESPFSV